MPSSGMLISDSIYRLFLKEGHDPSGEVYHPTTLDFKFAVLSRLLQSFPDLNHIEIWDDRKRHLDLFERELQGFCQKKRISSYAVHHVVHDPNLEKRMPEDLERQLVRELVDRTNARIVVAKQREKEKESQERLASIEDISSPSTETPPNSIPVATKEFVELNKVSITECQVLSPTSTVSPILLSGNTTCTTTSASSTITATSLATAEAAPKIIETLKEKPQTVKPPKRGERPQIQPHPHPLGRLRRTSASVFKSLIELQEVTQYTAIFLTKESKAELLSRIPVPSFPSSIVTSSTLSSNSSKPTTPSDLTPAQSSAYIDSNSNQNQPPANFLNLFSNNTTNMPWTIKADHMTCSMGPAPAEIVDYLGGIGALVELKVVEVGCIPGRVVAVKVELQGVKVRSSEFDGHGKPNEDQITLLENGTAESSSKISLNANPHITVAVAHGAQAKESNDITTWIPFDAEPNSETQEPLILQGHLSYKKVIGIQGRNSNNPAQTKPKEVSLGKLVMKHHPHLKGSEIGQAVKAVEEWMEKTFMDNSEANKACIELFVTNLDVGALGLGLGGR
jgi:hypothetical protein